jgi:molecular chaperone DnaK
MVYSAEKTFNENRAKLSPQDASAFESALADAKKALEAGGTDGMNAALERLQQASHKLAEAMYQGAGAQPGGGEASGGSTSGSQPPPGGGARTGNEDEVIDTEYVDTEKQ